MAYHLKDREKLNLFSSAAQGGKGGGGSSAPPAPDPVATAQAQAQANKEAVQESARVNRYTQITPQGTMRWEADPSSPEMQSYNAQKSVYDQQMQAYNQQVSAYQQQMAGYKPQYDAEGRLTNSAPAAPTAPTAPKLPDNIYNQRQVIEYSPEQKKLYDLTTQASTKYGETANAQMDAVRGKLAQPLDFTSLGAAPTIDENYRKSVADKMYERVNPQFERDRASLETRLANQGIGIGSQAYNDAMDELNRSTNDARLAIDAQAGNEMSRMYGMQSQARDRAINEMTQQRSVPLNELAAMLTGSQVQNPNFVPAQNYQVQPADVMGATYAGYNGQMQAFAADRAGAAANRQGMYGLLGNGMMAGATYFACFDADTPVEMADGSLKRIVDVEIGDMTKGGRVYSISVADGENEQWFDYRGVIVTGSHSVCEGGEWIRVADSAEAKPVAASAKAYCLGTSEHEIHVNGIRFGDLDEIDRAAYVPVWEQALILKNAREAA